MQAVPNQILKGSFLMIGSNIAFCAMICCVRAMPSTNAFAAILFRFVIGLAVLGMLAMMGKVQLTFTDKRGLLLRGLLGGIAIAIGFISVFHLGMIKASIIVYTYPIFGTIFGMVLLGEKVTPLRIISMALAFVGACVVLCGSLDPVHLLDGFGRYELLAIVGSILAGFAVVQVKKLQATETSASIYFAQCLVGFWLVIMPAGGAPISSGYAGIGLLIAVGVLAAVGQLIMTEGYRYLPVSTASVLVMIAPVLNLLAGAFIFHEQVSMSTIAGSAVVFAACSLVLIPTGKIQVVSKS